MALSWLPRAISKRQAGFTLAELLIALAILGVIATYSIPKLLGMQQNAQNNAMAKEVAGMIAQAYQIHQNKGLLSATTKSVDFLQYMNYVKVDSTSIIDGQQPSTLASCVTHTCVTLHNGGTLLVHNAESFSALTPAYAVIFIMDPDGKASDVQGLGLLLKANGQVTTYGTCNGALNSSSFLYTCNPANDAPWFSW